jgi:hypothetical protein
MHANLYLGKAHKQLLLLGFAQLGSNVQVAKLETGKKAKMGVKGCVCDVAHKRKEMM